MKFSNRLLLWVLLVFGFTVFPVYLLDAQTIGITISNYYTPCFFGTGGTLTTVHGANGGNPARHSYDFQACQQRVVYSPTPGRIVSVNYGKPNAGERSIQIEDDINNVCLTVLHLESVSVYVGQIIPEGLRLGVYFPATASVANKNHVHFTAFDGSCSNYSYPWSNDVSKERPIAWRELGYVPGTMINLSGAVSFISTNPSNIPTTQKTWDFSGNHGPQRWVGVHGLSDVHLTSLGLWYQVTSASPYIFGPPMVAFNAFDFTSVRITMASQTDNCGRFYWKKSGQADFVSTQVARFNPIADGQTRTYTLSLVDNANWTGQIIQLRLDPACYPQAGKNNAVRIDMIELVSG